jgi:hypothetical protein
MGRSLEGPGRCGEEKNLVPACIQTPAIQPVAHCYINWAILNPITSVITFQILICYKQASTVHILFLQMFSFKFSYR